MALVVADTSALVSLGTVADHPASPLDALLESHDVAAPEQVIDELRGTAAYDDASGRGARAVLDRLSAFDVRPTDLDESFPLDPGENATVTLANDVDADQLVCDEFAKLALVHASLVGARLVTTPSLVLAMVRTGRFDGGTADDLLAEVSAARSWEGNAYVARTRATLRRERE